MKTNTALFLAAALSLASNTAQAIKTQLYNNWQMQSSAIVGYDGSKLPDNAGWLDATVPSTAMGVLMDNHVFPSDLLNGENYKSLDRSRFDVPWWWRTTFSLSKEDTARKVSLELDGLSYRADVWVNGKLVAKADEIYGPFRQHSIDISKYVVPGNNKVALMVSRAQKGEPNIGFVDWNPRPADENMGRFRPIWLNVTNDVAITNPAVKSKVNKRTLHEAWLSVEATLVNKSAKPVNGVLKAKFDGQEISKQVYLRPGSNTIDMIAAEYPQLHIANPQLWWPNNLGPQNLHNMELSFECNGKVSDVTTVKFGIREVESYLTAENQRGFKINGKPVLLRSAGWTDDIFLRNDSSRNRIEANYARDMGLNSLRFENIWGTSEHIYDLCDSLGLMVLTGWSCQWEWENYFGAPNDKYGCIVKEDDQKLIARSFGDQVAWLRNHPSIIAWFVGSDVMPRPELEEKYRRVLIPLDDRPYITSAKQRVSDFSGHSGTKMAGPYDYVAPCYWYDPMAPGGAWGWNTETGIGAQLPQKESIQKMIPADSIWPLSETWNYHCTASDLMNNLDVLNQVIDKRYGGARDFDDYLRKAEWVNYDGTRTMFEAFRANIPRTTGIVQWMFNSAWPKVYWQLYDHYLVPTSAYYSLRHSNAPLQLIYDYAKKKVVAVNESSSAKTLKASMRRYPLHGAEAINNETFVTVDPYTVQEVFEVENPAELQYVFLELSDNDRIVAENFYVLSPDSDILDWEYNKWYITPVKQHANFSALNKLPGVKPAVTASRNGETVIFTLENQSNTVAFFNRMAALDDDGNLIVPTWWSDNFFSIEPGRSRTISCRLPSPASKANFILEGWNVPLTNIFVK